MGREILMLKSVYDYNDVMYLPEEYKLMVNQKWLCVSRAQLYNKIDNEKVNDLLNIINYSYLPNSVEVAKEVYFVLSLKEIKYILSFVDNREMLKCISLLDSCVEVLNNDVYESLTKRVNDFKLNYYLKCNDFNAAYKLIDSQEDNYPKREAYNLLDMRINQYFTVQRTALDNLEIGIYNKMPNLRRKKNEEN